MSISAVTVIDLTWRVEMITEWWSKGAASYLETGEGAYVSKPQYILDCVVNSEALSKGSFATENRPSRE